MRISDWSSDVCSSDLKHRTQIIGNLRRLCYSVVPPSHLHRGLTMRLNHKSLALAASAPLALVLTSCVGSGSVPSASTPITQAETQQGAELHPQLLAEFGGAMSGTQANYEIGRANV